MGSVLLLGACGGGTSTPGPAATNERVSLKIMVGGLGKQIYLPNMLTKQLGYFEEQNLDVTLIDEPSGVASEDAVIAGEVEAGSGSFDHPIDLAGLGKQVVNVVQLLAAPGEAEMVATKKAGVIKSPADFGGKKLGVTSLGSGTHTLSRYMAVRANVPIDSIKFIAVGAGDRFIKAIQNGTIDAGMTTEPTISRLLKTGDGQVLVDLRTPEKTRAALGGDYPFICLFMKADYVNSHKPVVQRVVNAYVKTLKWISKHTAQEIADKMPADYYAGDKDLYLSALQGSLPMFSPDGKISKSGAETVLSVLQKFDENVMGKTIDLSKTYTNEFVNKANA
jgi:NitT/TauT family transport system substrate-binding protein